MALIQTNYDIFQGDSWQAIVPIYDLLGNAVTNLTGYTFRMEVRDKEGGDVLCAFATLSNGIVVSGVNIIITLTPAQTALFNLPKSVYQIQSTDSAGKKKTQQSGWFQVHPSVIQ
jgi:hypothetical protein